ncbi:MULTISPECIES: DUF885 domain-containing protein [Aliiglaciecola]|uniref:DUF885 domain-containing protein n=1 Tax=Aliiglaciecola TaxID=1406885 RepID=UPI001C09BF7C|nr:MULTISPECIES: DUF885 domain-containing protein [Aliiglaciecola]MBU2878039.1 DUF885 domain-containing protein [Aliiglaciecola lipolytica]MDO6709404.1 DUF885 domain-containing protein [Aliiglaciecola sp. 2_MG-2023]MDO6750552.1 DUF885 domain-containing protein [Aliiglaciecola sp. 1_MG-2023]
MKTLKSFVPLSLISLALMACSEPAQNTNSDTQAQLQEQQSQQVKLSESERLAAFFADMFEEDLKRSPMSQSYLGYKWDYDKWDDISDNATDQDITILQQRLKALNEFDSAQLNQQEKMSLEIAKVDIQRRLANDKFRHHTYIMDQFRAFHTVVPSFLVNIHRVNDVEDAQAYISRLEKVDDLFGQVIEQLKIRQELGVFPPKWSYDQMIQASHNVISGNPFIESAEDSTIWKDFQDKLNALDISNAEKTGMMKQARDALQESVLPAYQALIAELEIQRELSPEGDGVWRLPDGDKWYDNRLAWFTTTDLSAQEVHEIGLKQVERIHDLMLEIMEKVNFEGSLQDFFVFMRTSDQFYYANDDTGRDQYLADATALINEMKSKIPEYFGLMPQAEMIVKRVEPFREQSAGKAFYQSPSKDGSRPGSYYANLYNMKDMPTYQMEALAYHEGIPGHHMQRAIAQELEGIPEFQKYVSFTAYTEGWGLYSEELAKDMGFYQDPYSDFGRLAMELWRACRLVVDTGIHSQKWSREQAIQYLVENTPNPEGDSVKAIERYIAMPGQATAYMIGKLKIMELRAYAEQTLGEKFDIRGFHDEVLKDGPVPLNILEDKIKVWVQSQQ